MVIRKIILFVLLFTVFACEQDEEVIGICTADDSNCMPNFTREMCEQYTKDRVNGLEWTFQPDKELCGIIPAD